MVHIHKEKKKDVYRPKNKEKLLAVKVKLVQTSGSKKANHKTEGLEATFIPTWFSAISDIDLPPILWDLSRVVLICLQ